MSHDIKPKNKRVETHVATYTSDDTSTGSHQTNQVKTHVAKYTSADIVTGSLQTKQYGVGTAKPGTWQCMDIRAVNNKPLKFEFFGPFRSKYGISQYKFGPSMDIQLDPEVPAEKRVIDEMNSLYAILKERILKVGLKNVRSGNFEEHIPELLTWPLDADGIPDRSGKCTMFVNIDDGKFPTAITVPDGVRRPEAISELYGNSLLVHFTISIRYFSVGAQNSIKFQAREVAIMEMKRIVHESVFKSQLETMTKEQRSSLEAALNEAKQIATQVNATKTDRATDDDVDHMLPAKLARIDATPIGTLGDIAAQADGGL